MAPTETLAEQHAARSRRCSPPSRLPFALLTGGDPGRPAARAARAARRPASSQLVVGTHALIEDGGRVRPPRRLRRRRAAPLRGPPARRARREGARRAAPARPPHDRDADPAHALADRLRRPRHDRAARAAGRPPAGHDAAGRRGAAAPAAYEFIRERGCARAARPSSSARWSRSPRSVQAQAAEAEAERLAASELARLRGRRLSTARCPPREKAAAMDALRLRRGPTCWSRRP